MRGSKQSAQAIKPEEEVSASPSASRDLWRELVDQVCPPGARLVWDEAIGKLVVRVPKAKWK
jgi:hypothetical protein